MKSKDHSDQALGTGHPTDTPNATVPGQPQEPAQRADASDSAHRVDRRRFLSLVGLGVGSLVVVGAGDLTWRAVDGGVFATGTGPAYAAWGQSRAPGAGSMGLVRAAVLAANAHNAQPWRFKVAADRIDLYADMSRNLGAMDPLGREMDISLGAALENLVLAGPPNGKTPTVHLLPDPADPTHVAEVDLAPTRGPVSPLFAAIATRHTNRGAYDTTRPVSRDQLDALAALVDVPDTQLVWFTTADQKRRFGELTIRATKAIIADPRQAADDFAWYRTSWGDIQSRKDGITIDPSGQSALIRALAKILPVSRAQNNDGWLRGTTDTQIPTAAAFGALVVKDPLDPTARLQVGRIWQRIHLSASAAGLAMQPLCQIPERIDRERSAGLPPELTSAMSGMLPARWHPIMTFRTGYPTTDALLSPRRPASDVVLN
jgi:nitroreductase